MCATSVQGQMWLGRRGLGDLLHVGGHLCTENCHWLLELNHGSVKGLMVGGEVGDFLFEWCDFVLHEVGEVLLYSVEYVLFQVG